MGIAQAVSAANENDFALLAAAISKLAQRASTEINIADEKHLEASHQWLRPGTPVYVAHLPNQTWEQTLQAAKAVLANGYRPVPHLPARRVSDRVTLDRLIGNFVQAGVEEVLLIAGDYPEAQGPYSSVSEILKTGLLGKHGLRRVSLAGHPEGHTKVELSVIRAAEREKVALASSLGLETTLVTQFVFEAQPFIDWAHELRKDKLPTRLVCGLAGPASITALFKFAMRCGAGPSIRALGAKPTSVMKLLGDHGPERVVTDLASQILAYPQLLDGVHFFCFGGFLRTCQWIDDVAKGRFQAHAKDGIVCISR